MNNKEIREILSKNLAMQLECSQLPENTTKIIKTVAEQMYTNQPAFNFVGVQPMRGPVGIAEFVEYKSKEEIEKSDKLQPWLPTEIIEENGIISDDGTEMCLTKVSHALEAGTRALAGKITEEQMQDEVFMDNVNKARKELLSSISEELNKEIYEEIKSDLLALGFKATLDLTEFVDGDDMLLPDGIDTLCVKLKTIMHEIGTRTKRGNGNFAIVSKTVATILKFTGNLLIDEKYIEEDYGYIKYVGTFGNGLKVYYDSNIEHNKLIIGYKNKDLEISEQDVGYVYAPYIQLLCMGPVINGKTGAEEMCFATRYGKSVRYENVEFQVTGDNGIKSTKTRGESSFYCELTINGLPKTKIDNTRFEQTVDRLKETLLKNLIPTSTNAGLSEENFGLHEAEYEFSKKLIPLIVDKLAIQHFVGVQPMSGPVGLLYKLEYEEDGGSEEQRRISLNLVSHTVKAISKEYKNVFTLEAIQDVNSDWFTTENLKKYVTNVAKEIYDEFKADVLKYSHKHTNIVTKNTNPTKLGIFINLAANEIARLTRRGAGNFVIMSKDLAKALKHNKFMKRDLNSINPNLNYDHIKYVGTFCGTIKVFVDEEMEYNKCIVGYKGDGETDCGYFYAPYQLLKAKIVIDPSTFEPKVRLTTRYDKILSQKSTETTSDDGLETNIKREPCDYYVTITFDGMPKSEDKDVGFFYCPYISEGISSDENEFKESMKILY